MKYILGNHSFFWLMFLCMSFHFLPRSLHEVLGVLTLVTFAYHLWRYSGWWQALGHAAPKLWSTPQGAIRCLVNLLLLILLPAVLISGAVISNYLFKDIIPLAWRTGITANQLHKSLSFALWVVTGLHVGLHLEAWLRRQLTSPALRWLALALCGLVSALGVYASVLHRIGDRLLGKHIFATPALKGGPLTYLGGLLAIFGLYMAVGWLLQRLCERRKDTPS